MTSQQQEEEINVAETVENLQVWLMTEGCDFTDQHSFVDVYCSHLRDLGLPIERFFLSAVLLHPLVAARSWKWEASGKITDFSWSRSEYRAFQRDLLEMEESQLLEKTGNGPMYQFMIGAHFVRIKATDKDIPADCDWIIKENYTELYGLPARQGGNPRTSWSLDKQNQLQGGFTWSTKAEGGFREEHLEILNKTVLALRTVLQLHIARHTSKFLLQTYLGEDAGSRVHRGDIERGEGLTIRSAIWFSDVRGFTEMSGQLHRNELVDIINGVFEVTQTVIRKHKGQVLKFMGDGCMAIFTAGTNTFQRNSFSEDQKSELDDDQGVEVCHRARLAASEIQECLAKLEKERDDKGLRSASVGVGLHYGDISYGNVGAPDRLDFTVLGPHVNLASRTESLCGKLSAKVLATEAFVELDGDAEAWRSRGRHQVKGVSEAVPIFELAVPSE